jgi:abnormal spindle-like microcephaly-associated protein
VAAIEFSTRYSKACCQLMVENGGVTALLEFMRSCNRSKPHMEMLGHALACLANICRWVAVLYVHGTALGTLLQACIVLAFVCNERSFP